MALITQGLYSFLSVVGFSVLFNLPRKLIIAASISGMIGWLVYYTFQMQDTNFIIPAFMGSIAVGIVGEILAIYKKQPATLFTIPGIIPFVPGYGIYDTMRFVVEKDFNRAMTKGGESLFIAISIACGIVLATSFIRMLRPYIEKTILKFSK